jgi:hypothetical protein
VLYHPLDCDCRTKNDNEYCYKVKEDGVEPIGKIDWFDPFGYKAMCIYNELAALVRSEKAEEMFANYMQRWRAAYAARGWEFPSK